MSIKLPIVDQAGCTVLRDTVTGTPTSLEIINGQLTVSDTQDTQPTLPESETRSCLEPATTDGGMYYNEAQTATATCPEGSVGTSTSATVAANRILRPSMAEANAAALAEAQAEADAALVCTWSSTEQTASCPEGYSGTPVVKAAGAETSTTSQEDADAKALAAATAELVCTPPGDPGGFCIVPQLADHPNVEHDVAYEGDIYHTQAVPTMGVGGYQPFKASAFTMADSGTLCRIVAVLGHMASGTPYNVTLRVYASDGLGGLPGTLVATSGAVNAADLPPFIAPLGVEFPIACTLQAGVYWLALCYDPNRGVNPLEFVAWKGAATQLGTDAQPHENAWSEDGETWFYYAEGDLSYYSARRVFLLYQLYGLE